MSRQSDDRDAVFLRGIRDHMPGITFQYVAPGVIPVVNGEPITEVMREGVTVDDLVLRVVEWARLQEPKVLTHRSVLLHGAKYFAYVGVSCK